MQSDLGSLAADTKLRGLSGWTVADKTLLLSPADLDGAFLSNKSTGTNQFHLSTCPNQGLQVTMSPVSYGHLIMMATGACLLCLSVCIYMLACKLCASEARTSQNTHMLTSIACTH